ncbi:MAG TPA: hypothetical protein VG389_29150 [Myxococcota bacterium]|nr:hypothetical protein [Myxococcota bacterium]
MSAPQGNGDRGDVGAVGGGGIDGDGGGGGGIDVGRGGGIGGGGGIDVGGGGGIVGGGGIDGGGGGVGGAAPPAAGARLALVTALAVLGAVAAALVHEGLGHCATAAALGARLWAVGATRCEQTGLDPAGWRALATAAAGTVANVALGAGAFFALRLRAVAGRPRVYALLWFVAVFDALQGFGTLWCDVLLGRGDWSALVGTWDGAWWVRVWLGVLGLAGTVVTAVAAARALGPFLPAAPPAARAAAARPFAVLPWAATAALFAAAAARAGGSGAEVFSASLPHWLGTVALVLVPLAAARLVAARGAPARPVALARSPALVTAGAVAAAGTLFVLASGVPFGPHGAARALAATAAPAPGCARCDAPRLAATMARADINESSGLVASRAHPGVVWTHNDSGDAPRLFAVRASDGADLGAFTLLGADAVDWEDVALGPCSPPAGAAAPPAGSCLWAADIGDNFRSRTSAAVYRVPEPAPLAGGGDHDVPGAVAFPFVYPDGPHDAETLLADPRSGRLYVVTKTKSGPSTVFRFPDGAAAGSTATLVPVATLDFSALGQQVTGGDVSPDGTRVAIRTYDAAVIYAVPPGAALDAAFRSPACPVPIDAGGQGESVAFSADGRSLWSTREAIPAPLFVSTCH